MLKFSLDPEKQLMIVTLTSGLLTKYYPNLEGLIEMKKSSLPEGIKIDRIGGNSAKLSIPAIPSTVKDGVGIVSMDKSSLDYLSSLISDFINKASKVEMKTTEYIPLTGYSANSLQEEIKDAIASKRHLAIVKSYKDYNSLINNGKSIERVFIEYGTDEYFDIVLLVAEGNLKKVKSLVNGRFIKLDWWG